jgi:rhodanese-related sulfurtransferase
MIEASLSTFVWCRIEIINPQTSGSAVCPKRKGAPKSVKYLSAFSLTTIIDLRAGSDYEEGHLEQSINLSLQTLSSGTESPWKDSSILKQQWEELNGILSRNNTSLIPKTDGKQETNRVLMVCYDGAVSRIAASILRAKHVEAFSLRGGYVGL